MATDPTGFSRRPTGHNLPPRFSQEEMAAALLDSGGSQEAAARALGCCRSTVKKYIRRYPAVQAALRVALESRRPAGETLPAVHAQPLTPEQVAAALRETRGKQTAAARLLGCDPKLIRRYRARYPIVEKAFRDARPTAWKPPSPAFEGRTPDQVASAITQAGGTLQEAARILGCAVETVQLFRAEYPAVEAAYERAWRERGRTGQGPAGGNSLRFSQEQVIDAVHEAHGIAQGVCRILGCDRRTLRRYATRWPEVAQAIAEARVTIVDIAENKLADGVEAGDWQAVTWVLTVLGRDRGYTRRRDRTPPIHPLDLPPGFEKAVRDHSARLEAQLPAVSGDSEKHDE